MARDILGVIAGLAVWIAIAGVAGVTMRSAWPDYASVAAAMTFTLPMMFARLAIGALDRRIPPKLPAYNSVHHAPVRDCTLSRSVHRLR